MSKKRKTIDLKGFLKDAQQIAKDHPLILMTLAVTLAYAARGDKEKLKNMLATVKNTISGGGKPKDALEAATASATLQDLPKADFPTKVPEGAGVFPAAPPKSPDRASDPGLFAAETEQRRRKSRRRRTRSRRRRSRRSRPRRSRSRRSRRSRRRRSRR